MLAKLIFLSMAIVAVTEARPGGYLTVGGVYNADKNLDYLQQARAAGKFAWDQKLESEVDSFEVDRGARRAAEYVPKFFTSQQNHAALTASRQVQQRQPVVVQRQQPQTFKAPIYRQ